MFSRTANRNHHSTLWRKFITQHFGLTKKLFFLYLTKERTFFNLRVKKFGPKSQSISRIRLVRWINWLIFETDSSSPNLYRPFRLSVLKINSSAEFFLSNLSLLLKKIQIVESYMLDDLLAYKVAQLWQKYFSKLVYYFDTITYR